MCCVVCLVCFGVQTGHWTLKCPKRQSIVPVGPDDEKSGSGGSGGESAAQPYVPMHIAAKQAAEASFNERVEYTLRVTNLSEDTTESDLQDLFRRFGHTSRIYLAKDKLTFKSRGFAFVNFSRKEDAQSAVDKLNGWGYDNLILAVEWAKPQAPREPRERTDDDGGGGGGRGMCHVISHRTASHHITSANRRSHLISVCPLFVQAAVVAVIAADAAVVVVGADSTVAVVVCACDSWNCNLQRLISSSLLVVCRWRSRRWIRRWRIRWW